MKPATRFLLSGVLVVCVLAVAVGAAALCWMDHVDQSGLQDQLKVVASVESELEASRLVELQLRANLLAQDPAFVDYVAQSMIPNPRLGNAIDSASISDLLQERRRGYDVAMVLDPQGKPVATSGILLKDRASIEQDPLVRSTISLLGPQQGIWVDHGQLLWVAITPLLRGGVLQGALLAATRVDDAFAIAIGRIARTGVTVLVQSSESGSVSILSNGVDHWIELALTRRSAEVLDGAPKSDGMLQLSDGQHHATAWVKRLHASSGWVALVALDPVQADTGLFAASRWPLLAGLAGFAACMLLLIGLQWWRTWLPLQRMLELIRVASPGDRHFTIRVSGSLLVRHLRDGINRLLHASG
jgi:hypothetical protein